MSANIFFKNGFYRSDVHEAIPEGAIPVSQQEYDVLLEGQSKGKRIVAAEDGRPVLADPAVDPAATATALRRRRNQLLADCDWTQLPDAPLDQAEKDAWRAYRRELREVTAMAGFPLAVTWPEQP